MISHLELFAGIGGFRQAIELLGNDFSIENNCVGFSEIDQYATKTYKANFNTENEVEIGDIVSFTSDKKNIEALNDFNFLTGGFPCQSFSMMGQQKGFEDKRGDVFYRITDILNIKKPPFILLENVKNLKTHDNGNTFKEIVRALKECGYPHIYFDVFNTSNFNLAQTRNRVFIFASRIELPLTFSFSQASVINSFTPLNGQSTILRQKNVLDILEKEVEPKYYLSEKLKPTILSNGSKTFISNSEINQLIARPLTATMVKMHRACQDNYYSDEFLLSENPLKYKTNSFSKQELATHNIRKLTPKEAFNLQGFNDTFVQNAQNAGISNHQLYKQAGNAVSVNTVYAILHYLIIKNKILELI
jgi:DNA (cytosine-5)-methyltransferase 1